jgi:localization factor PodJL
MSKAKTPDQGRPDSAPPEENREPTRGGNPPLQEARGAQTSGDDEVSERTVEEDIIWRSIAALSRRRIESQLGEQPSANARPIRTTLAELESRLASEPSGDKRAAVEKSLSGLDQRLASVARRMEEDAPQAREAGPRARRGAGAGRNPLLEAIAQLGRSERALNDAPGVSDLAPELNVEELQRAIHSIMQRLDSFREDAGERGDQQLVMMRQIENVRREIRDMTQAIGELAPRASVAAIETAMNDLRERIEAQRDRGVPDETLAPAERMIGEVRAVIQDLDPTPIVRNLRTDVETIGIRLEKLQAGDVANTAAVRDLTRDTHEIKEQLAALMARPLPLEKIETRIIDVTQRVDALALSRGASGANLGEVVKAIRSIIATETGKGVESFNKRLEGLARKLDVVAEQTAAARFDEIGERIDELGKTLTERIDRGAANIAPLEALIATLGKKIDGALERGDHASAFEEIGGRFDHLERRLAESAPTESLARIEAILAEQNAEKQFAQLTQRVDQLRQAIAAQTESRARAGDAEHLAALEDLVRGLDRKIDAALDADAQRLDLQAVERQLAQLSFKIDRLDDPFSAPRIAAQSSSLDEIAERLDRMQAAFAQQVEDGAGVAKRESELAVLVEALAERMKRSIGPAADHEALQSLEAQIGALAQRLERFDAGNGALAGLESKINNLFARLEDTQSATTQAAEAAVRRAASEILREAANLQPGAVRAALQRELIDIRTTQDASGQRTNETLTALHQTLERVVSHLGISENDLGETRGVAQRELTGEPAVSLEADKKNPESQDVATVDPMAFLLPIGESVADGRERFFTPPAGEDTNLGGLGGAVRSEFIAAARRAAQQPAESDAASAEAARNAENAQEKSQGGGVVKLSAVLQERKRPLLLGIGAVMLLIGAYQIARMGVQGGLNLPQQEARAPAKALRSAPSPEKTLASKSAPSVAIAQRPAAPATTPAQAPVGAAPAASPEQPIAQRNIDPTPTGAIEAPPLSAGDALATIKRLAVEGDPAAQYEMGARLAEGRSAPRDAKAAAHWFERAAEMGLAPAQYRLGSMYERGVGVERDYARARLWYERAAEAGNARAMHNYAVLLAEGGDGKPDYPAAAEWFRRAAEYGIRDSQFNLAILYARGLGVSRNLQQSYAWFSAAAEQGDDDAARKRDEIGARLDSKELAAAKALAAALRVKTPTPEANEAPALRTGGGDGAREGAREPAPARPTIKQPSGKPRVSLL